MRMTRNKQWQALIVALLFLMVGAGALIVVDRQPHAAKAAGTGAFYVQGTKIVDPNGNEFIPIGANMDGYGWVWAGNTPGDADAVAKGWKFNIIRANMIWGCNPNPQYPPGGPYQNTDPNYTDNVVNAYTSRGIVVLLSNHDNTSGVMPTGSELSCDIQHWKDLANKYKGNTYVWFNMFNEPGDSGGLGNSDNSNWIPSHQQTIQAIRSTGAQNILVADGTGWGQDKDCSNIDAGSAIIAGGQQVLSADTTHNTVFSFHSYGWGAQDGCTPDNMATYIDHVHAKNLALIAGEVGNYSDANNYNSSSSDGVRNIFSVALPRHVGPIGWHGMAGDSFCMYWSGSTCDIGSIDSYTNPSRQPAPSQGTGLTWIGALFWDATHGGGYGLGATPTPVPPTPTPTTSPGGTTTVDDSVAGSGTNQFNYVGSGWQHCTNCGSELYNNSNSWDFTANDYLTIKFTGVQIKYYAVVDAHHGIGAFSIDGGSETNVDFYAANRAGNTLVWTSPVLSSGTHTLKLRVTGTKDSSSTDVAVTADRVDILTSASYKATKYEAEDAALSGGAEFNNNHNDYSGRGFVDGYWNVGATTTFTVTVPSAGNYRVTLHYANATGTTRTLDISVNGSFVKTTSLASLSSSGNWDLWADQSETLSLKAGSNTIAYTYNSSDSGNVNLDYILA